MRRRTVLGSLPMGLALAGGGLATAPARAEGELTGVQKKVFTIKPFPLENGTVMPEAAIAYETYGKLAPDGRNAVLLTHGYT